MENLAEINFICPLCNNDITVSAPISLNILVQPDGSKSVSVSAQTLANHECI